MKRVASTLLAALTLSGCGLFEDAKRLGVSAVGDGGIRAHFVPCPGQTVTRVALVSGTGSGISVETGNDVPGDDTEDDEVVEWSVASPEGSTETTFDIGHTPPGFTEEVSLSGPIASLDSIGVFVGYRGQDTLASIEVGFDQDDLTDTTILTFDGEKDQATFEAEGRATCE